MKKILVLAIFAISLIISGCSSNGPSDAELQQMMQQYQTPQEENVIEMDPAVAKVVVKADNIIIESPGLNTEYATEAHSISIELDADQSVTKITVNGKTLFDNKGENTVIEKKNNAIIVRKGQTLQTILDQLRKEDPTWTMKKLLELNPQVKNPSTIKTGETIWISNKN